MIQLQAGYFLEAILKNFTKGLYADYIKGMIKYLSHFDLETNFSHQDKDLNLDPIILTANNIISRGLPTIPSTFIEDLLANTFLKTKKKSLSYGFTYEFINEEIFEEILRSFFIIDPRIKIQHIKNTLKFNDNENLKKQFFYEFIPTQIGEFFIQLFSFDRDLKTIIENTKYQNKFLDSFDEKVQFSIENPFFENNKKGILFNINPQNFDKIDFIKEEQKKAILNNLGWEGVINIYDLNDTEQTNKILNFTFSKYFDFLRKNYNSPLYNTSFGLDALQLTLTPLAVARIQKTILYLILQNKLNINDEKWKIAVIERDIPAAFIAFQDLKQIIDNLFYIEGKNRHFPQVELSIFYEEEFEKAELNLLYQGEIYPISEFDYNTNYDLIIDTSVLRRSNFEISSTPTNANIIAKIRSTDFIKSQRSFYTTEPINYKIKLTQRLANKKTSEKNKFVVNYFLKNIFRKNSFSYQQLTFLEKTLNLENTLAVLPFTASKTLLYQFSVLLQPSLSVVVTPIDALMKDQIDELKDLYIDAISFFSPSTTDIYEKYKALDKLRNGKSIFNFIDADRFHLSEVRHSFNQLILNNHKIAYFIIDEAHCLSEWSHDFRSVYATLPRNIKTVYPQDKTIVALTSTASYDVIHDITQNFDIKQNNIIQLENEFSRFSFKFVKINFNDEDNLSTEDKIKQIKEKKLNQLIKYVQNQKKTLVYNQNPEKFKNLVLENSKDEKIEAFCGSFGEKGIILSALKAKQSFNNYKKFKDNETNILVARNSFGIGMNKEDIRKIYFTDIPETTEAFIQQINRAGRDLKNADIFIFYTKDQTTAEISNFYFNEFLVPEEEQQQKQVFLENLLRQDYLKRIILNPKKEFSIINELLTLITYPVEKIHDILVRRIKYQFDIWTSLVPQPMINPTMLYVIYNDNESLGYIDFAENQIVVEAPKSKKELAEKVLNFLKYDIEKIVANGIEIFEILDEEIKVDQHNGFENILANMKVNDQSSITIEFYNDSPSKLISLFKEKLNKYITFNQIIDAYENALDYKEFEKNIKSKLNLNYEKFPEIKQEIKSLFYKFRNFNETLFALYRLMSIGIIDDFIIDYHNQQFTVIFTKKTDADIINNIHQKILPFISKHKALEVYEKIPKTYGNTVVAKAINYYIYFVHNYIYRKHLTSYENFFSLLNENQDREQKIKSYLYNYFTAKYLPILEENINKEFDFVKQIIDKVGYYIDNFKHLHYSTQLLLNTYPKNAKLLFLNGFSSIVIDPDNKKLLAKAVDKIAQSINILRNENPDFDIEAITNWFFEKLSEHNLELKSVIEPLLILKLHTQWLYDFNVRLKKII